MLLIFGFIIGVVITLAGVCVYICAVRAMFDTMEQGRKP